MGILDWVKSHPYLSGGLALGIVLLFFVLSRGSSSSSSTGQSATSSDGVNDSGLSSSDYASLQEAQLASASQLQQTQTAAQAQAEQDQSALQADQIQASAQNVQNQLAAQVALQNIQTSGAVSENTNSTQLMEVQAQTGGQVAINQQNVTGQVDVAGIQAGVLEDQYNDSVQTQQIIASAQTAQTQATDTLLSQIYASLSGSGTAPKSGVNTGTDFSLPPASAPKANPFQPVNPAGKARSLYAN